MGVQYLFVYKMQNSKTKLINIDITIISIWYESIWVWNESISVGY